MATSSSKGSSDAAASSERKTAYRRVLVIELEEAADAMRETLCRALAEKIPDADAKKVEAALLRFGLCASPEQAARSLLLGLGVRASTHNDIVASVNDAILSFCVGEDCRMKAAVKAAVDANTELGGALAFLTSLPPDAARRVLERWGLADHATLVAVPVADGGFPTPEQWRRAAREAGAGVPATALVASRPSCKTALIAGLRCIVVPDRFTAAQDFGGADAVLEGARVTKGDFLEVF